MAKLLFIIISFIIGCAPNVADLQDARLEGKGNSKITPGYTKLGQSNSLSVQYAYGLSNKSDLRLRYEYATNGIHTYALGIKTEIEKDRFALYLPIHISMYPKLESRYTYFFPTMLSTTTLSNSVDLNISFKYYIQLQQTIIGMNINQDLDNYGFDENLIVFNFGLGFKNSKNQILRPELGFIIASGIVFPHFSFGLSL
tara:strand:+ start:354 stop:950 length:597 start_codon:yes stop_codon:yes gene_type:complete